MGGRRLLEPGAEGRAAGVVDDRDLVALGEGLGEALPVGLGGELHEGRVEAGLLEHLAGDLDRDRERQHGARVRLDDDGVAGDERGEDAGVGVPRRERVAADDERDAARHEAVVLLHPGRRRVALAVTARLLPEHRGGHALLLDEPGRDRLDRAVLRVRPTGLERHDERLARRVHDGVGDLEAALVDPVDDLDAHRGPHLRTGVPPRRHRRASGRETGVDVERRVGDPERRPVGRDLAAHEGAVGRLARQGGIRPAQVRLVSGQPVGGRRLAVDARAGRLGVAGVPGAARQGLTDLVEDPGVRVEQGVGGRRCRCSHGSMLAPADAAAVCRRAPSRDRPPRTRAGDPAGWRAWTRTSPSPTDHAPTPRTRGRRSAPSAWSGPAPWGPASRRSPRPPVTPSCSSTRFPARRRAPSRGSALP